MGVDIDSKSIEKNLKQMAAKEKKVRNKALKKASQEFASSLEDNTPYDPESGNKKHMKDDVVYSGVDSDGEVTVGYGSDTAPRVHFVETGTINIRPQGFMQQTQENFESEFKNIMENEIKGGLGL
ncbi:HK97 gp10 family phage protein [Barrientosiimonas marina]|uniref:HK97-gp10 family putative phage morphogenesis protein n=1 Tax=Lentibacillus kimchii TaxID=1542911 RepID=A0ABW2UWL7_9BACI